MSYWYDWASSVASQDNQIRKSSSKYQIIVSDLEETNQFWKPMIFLNPTYHEELKLFLQECFSLHLQDQ